MSTLRATPARVDIVAAADQPLAFNVAVVDADGVSIEWPVEPVAVLLRRPRRGSTVEDVVAEATVSAVDESTVSVEFDSAGVSSLTAARGACWALVVGGSAWLDGSVTVLPRGAAGGVSPGETLTVAVSSSVSVAVSHSGGGSGGGITVAEDGSPHSPSNNVYAAYAALVGYEDDPTVRGFARQLVADGDPRRNPAVIVDGALSIPMDHQLMIASRQRDGVVDLGSLTAGAWTVLPSMTERLTEFGAWENRSGRMMSTVVQVGHACWVEGGNAAAADVAVLSAAVWAIDTDPADGATVAALLPAGERWGASVGSVAITPRSDGGSWQTSTRTLTIPLGPDQEARVDRMTFVRRPAGATGDLHVYAWMDGDARTY